MGIESPVHLLFLGAVALMVLGPKRLPEMARALGKGMREFRESMNFDEHDHDTPAEGDRRDP
ncbi:MAG: twin-arginine translocase TatA/TatE family subunit [Solirubrobacteraceae bacterium]